MTKTLTHNLLCFYFFKTITLSHSMPRQSHRLSSKQHQVELLDFVVLFFGICEVKTCKKKKKKSVPPQ